METVLHSDCQGNGFGNITLEPKLQSTYHCMLQYGEDRILHDSTERKGGILLSLKQGFPVGVRVGRLRCVGAKMTQNSSSVQLPKSGLKTSAADLAFPQGSSARAERIRSIQTRGQLHHFYGGSVKLPGTRRCRSVRVSDLTGTPFLPVSL